MSLTLKGYPEYKESGVLWVGNVPAHWDFVPALVAFRERNVRNAGMVERQVLSLSYGRVVKKPDDALHGLVPESFETYQIVEPGNIVLRLTDLQNDQRSLRVGLARDRGIITSAYTCLQPSDKILPEFAYYYLHAADVQKVFYSMGSGLRQSIGFKELQRIPIPLPAPEEQEGIVRFLGIYDRRVNHYIRAKRREIELLNERKQVVIQQLVLLGTDPNVRLKPSRIEWMRDLPEDWGVSRCGHLFVEVVDTGHPDLPLLSIDRFKGIIPQSETGRRTRAPEDRRAYKRVLPGDIAYNLMNAFMGSIGASKQEGILSPAYAVAHPKTDLEVWYFHHLLRTKLVAAQFERLSYGIMYERNRLYFDRFKTVLVPAPPLEEQHRIVDLIQRQTFSIDTTILKAEREIELIREHRTRLIADVVTGKVDVRGAEVPASEEVVEELQSLDTEPVEDIEPEEGEMVAAEEGDDAAN